MEQNESRPDRCVLRVYPPEGPRARENDRLGPVGEVPLGATTNSTEGEENLDGEKLADRHCNGLEGHGVPVKFALAETYVCDTRAADVERACAESKATLAVSAAGSADDAASAACRDSCPDAAIGESFLRCSTNLGDRFRQLERERPCHPTYIPSQEHPQEAQAEIFDHSAPAQPGAVHRRSATGVSSHRQSIDSNYVQCVFEVAQEVSKRSSSVDLFNSSNSLREDSSSSCLSGGVHDGFTTHLQGVVEMVPRGSSPRRDSRSAEGIELAPPRVFLYDDPDVIAARCLSGYRTEPAVRLSDGKLDPIPEDLAKRVDLSDRRIHPEYPSHTPIGIAQRVLFEDPKPFLNPDRPPPRYRSSQNCHRRHVAELLASNLCHKKSRSEKERGFAQFFTILKKVDDDDVAILRTILDCETANEAFRTAPPVNLCPLHEVLQLFSRVECMRTLDLRHWFHQVKVGDFLSSMFTIAFGSLRLCWDCLPMGWSWAPFIAQALTTFAVAGESALSWSEIPKVMTFGNVFVVVIYDNVLAGGPEADLDAFWVGLLQRLTKLNALVKPDSDKKAANGSTLDCIGIRWRPSAKGLQWQLLPKFVEKISDVLKLLESPSCSAKQIASVLGMLAWGRYATREDICDLHDAYRVLSADVSRAGWRAVTSPELYRDAFEKLAALQTAGWQQFAPTHDEILAFTDAHNLCGYGHVGGSPLVCAAKRWDMGARYEPKDMYYLEAVGLKQTVFAFARPRRRLYVGTDNKGLYFAVMKKSTVCPRTARVLHEMFCYLRSIDCTLVIGWLPSEVNPADEMSRHLQLDVEKLRAAERQTIWAHPPSPEFGAKMGRVVGPGA